MTGHLGIWNTKLILGLFLFCLCGFSSAAIAQWNSNLDGEVELNVASSFLDDVHATSDGYLLMATDARYARKQLVHVTAQGRSTTNWTADGLQLLTPFVSAYDDISLAFGLDSTLQPVIFNGVGQRVPMPPSARERVANISKYSILATSDGKAFLAYVDSHTRELICQKIGGSGAFEWGNGVVMDTLPQDSRFEVSAGRNGDIYLIADTDSDLRRFYHVFDDGTWTKTALAAAGKLHVDSLNQPFVWEHQSLPIPKVLFKWLNDDGLVNREFAVDLIGSDERVLVAVTPEGSILLTEYLVPIDKLTFGVYGTLLSAAGRRLWDTPVQMLATGYQQYWPVFNFDSVGIYVSTWGERYSNGKYYTSLAANRLDFQGTSAWQNGQVQLAEKERKEIGPHSSLLQDGVLALFWSSTVPVENGLYSPYIYASAITDRGRALGQSSVKNEVGFVEPEGAQSQVNVTDLLGRIVLKVSGGTRNLSAQLSQMGSGLYFVTRGGKAHVKYYIP